MTVDRRHRWPRILAGTLSGIVLLGIGAAGVAGGFYNQISDQITAEDITSEVGHNPIEVEAGAPINILLMGSDSRDHGNGHGSVTTIAGERSDTTILLHISGDRKRALAVSIPRDSMVNVPSCRQKEGGYSSPQKARFNEAFYVGGAGCTVKTVEQLTGVSINHFVVVDFKGFGRVVDALDGVEVCLKKPVTDSKSNLKLPAGKTVVKGEQALAFVRARYNLGDGSDISRIERQQAFLGSAIRKATSWDVVSNPTKLYSMLSATTKAITTDPALASLDAWTDLAINTSLIKPGDVTFVTVPIIDNPDGATVSWETTESSALWRAINLDQPWPPGTGRPSESEVAPGDVTVDIVNSSGSVGLGGNVAARLRVAGFKVGKIATGRTRTYTTYVEYPDGRLGDSQTLIAAVGKAKSKLVPRSTDRVRLVLGSDYNGPGSGSSTDSQAPPPRTAADPVCN